MPMRRCSTEERYDLFRCCPLCRDGPVGDRHSSSSIAVGARCPWLRPGVGAVASQNITLPSLGPQILDLLEQGMTPSEVEALFPDVPLVYSTYIHQRTR